MERKVQSLTSMDTESKPLFNWYTQQRLADCLSLQKRLVTAAEPKKCCKDKNSHKSKKVQVSS